jgi:hypothetical protein
VSAGDRGPLPLVQRVAHLRALCRDRRVLHLGCTNWPYMDAQLQDGSLLHLQLLEVSRELWGLDGDDRGLAQLSARGVSNLVRGDIERLQDVQLDTTFDVIVAGEIIEHLSNPGLFLRGVQQLMGDDTILAITTVNAYCAARAVTYALAGRGGRQEPVHPDHVAYYSYSTLRTLLERHDLAIENMCFYDVGIEHRPYAPWHFKLINDVSVRLSRQLADGLIVECRRDVRREPADVRRAPLYGVPEEG